MKGFYYPWYINLLQLVVFGSVLWLFTWQNVHFFSTGFTRKEVGQIILYSVALIVFSWLLEKVIDHLTTDFNAANQAALEGIFANSSRVTLFISIVILASITEEVMFGGVFS